jgi:transposase
VRGVQLDHAEQNTTLIELILEVDHQAQRIERLDGAIDRAVNDAPEQLRALVDALQALRGVAKVTAVTLATEFGTFSRFEKATQAMSYTGMVPSEHSSGPRNRRGAITKTGNSHLRRVLVEAAWHYRHRPRLNQRQKGLQRTWPPKVAETAWRAKSACIVATCCSRRRAHQPARSSPRWRVSWPASSGRSGSRRKSN